nr:hypothetical protein [Martellivirales sp.]
MMGYMLMLVVTDCLLIQFFSRVRGAKYTTISLVLTVICLPGPECLLVPTAGWHLLIGAAGLVEGLGFTVIRRMLGLHWFAVGLLLNLACAVRSRLRSVLLRLLSPCVETRVLVVLSRVLIWSCLPLLGILSLPSLIYLVALRCLCAAVSLVTVLFHRCCFHRVLQLFRTGVS